MEQKDTGEWIKANLKTLVPEVMETHFRYKPELRGRYTPPMTEKCLADIQYHLEFLAAAVTLDSSLLFENYIKWVQEIFEHIGLEGDSMKINLKAIQAVLSRHLGAQYQIVDPYLIKGQEVLNNETATVYDVEPSWKDDVDRYLEFLLEADRQAATQMVTDLIDSGIEIKRLYMSLFQPALRRIGQLWQHNLISVAQEHYITASTQWIMSLLYPRIFETPRNGYRMVGTCVGQELHEIGMRMVCDFFEMDGWDTYYLGANTPIEAVEKAIEDRHPHLVAISTTILFHIPEVQKLIQTIRNAHTKEPPKILLGGYPFNHDLDLWKKVGGDGYGKDAFTGLMVGTRLVKAGEK